jgi:hypothetical protein
MKSGTGQTPRRTLRIGVAKAVRPPVILGRANYRGEAEAVTGQGFEERHGRHSQELRPRITFKFARHRFLIEIGARGGPP